MIRTRPASSTLRFLIEKDKGACKAVSAVCNLGLLHHYTSCTGTYGTECKRRCYSSQKLIRCKNVRAIRLNRRNYSSYDRIKEDSLLSAKDMRSLLKDYVGAGLYSEVKRTSVANDIPDVKSQDELVTRSMKDSIREVVIPLGDDLVVRDKYLTFYRTVRIGKLMEDMDTLAGLVGYKFYEGPSKYVGRAPFAFVTACVDKFDIKENFIRSDRNIWMTGFVSYAGRTSLEITIYLGEY